MCTLAKSEDPDEMPHNAAFHQGLHWLLSQNQISERKIQYLFLEIITFDPSIYTMDNPDFIVLSFMGNFIDLKRVEVLCAGPFDSMAIDVLTIGAKVDKYTFQITKVW